MSDLAHTTRRMLQALDAYWLVCDGGGPGKWRHPYGDNLAEHWWGKFEMYRGRVQECLRDSNWCKRHQADQAGTGEGTGSTSAVRGPLPPLAPSRLDDSNWCKRREARCPDGNPYCDGSILLHGKWCKRLAELNWCYRR